MKVEPKTVKLKNGKELLLRSATSADAENLLNHLRISHRESYKNLNQSAAHWDSISTNDEEKFLGDFEDSPSNFMLIA